MPIDFLGGPEKNTESIKLDNSNLVEKVLEKIFQPSINQQKNPKVGYFINSEAFPNIHSENDIKEYIIKCFAAYKKFRDRGLYLQLDLLDVNKEAKEIFQSVVEILIVSGVAELITAGDWSVNRMKLAEKNHGLKKNGFRIMQRVLSQKYGWKNPIHLHKGPGNGVLPRHLLIEGQKYKGIRDWQQLGVGDKLYFAIEDILFAYLKPELKKDINALNFLEFLASVLKKRLKQKWFESDTATIGKWKKKGDFCDVNDIFTELRDFLQNPGEDILHFFKPENGKIKLSKYFENDTTTDIKLPLNGILLRMLGLSRNDTIERLLKRFISYSQQKAKLLRRNIYELRVLKNVINSLKEKEPLDSLILRDIYKLTDGKVVFDEKKIDKRGRVNLLKEFILQKEAELSKLDEKIREFTTEKRQRQISILENSLGEESNILDDVVVPQDFLNTFFTQNFQNQTFGKGTHPVINLNREAFMHFGDFSLGYFSQISELLPDKKFHIISATRSDSHESEEQFYDDIKQNLSALEPGGVLTTDGVKASFTHIYRFHEVQKAIRELGEDNFKAEVVVDKHTRRPISVFIQKKHPKGYLGAKEKYEFFDQNVEFEQMSTTLQRPYIQIVNKVRRRLYELTDIKGGGEKSVDIFQKLQDKVRQLVEEQLLQLVFEREIQSDYFQSVREIYDKYGYLVAKKTQSFSRADIEQAIKDFISSEKVDEGIASYLRLPFFARLLEKYKGERLSHILEEDEETSEKQRQEEGYAILQEIYEQNSKQQLQKYFRQLIRENSKTRIVSFEDIKHVIQKVEFQLQALLHEYEGKLAPTQIGDLKGLLSNRVYLYPRFSKGEEGEISPINRKLETHVSRLPDNSEFLKLEEKLGKKIQNIKKRLTTLKNEIRKKIPKRFNYKPICFISYQDCITNKFMIEELKKIFGEDFVRENVEIIPMEFRPLENVGPDVIRHLGAIRGKLEVYREHGGIILGGGSWTDAYDQFGRSFKEHLGESILEAIEENPKLKQLAVCASYQITADMIGNEYYGGRVSTKPGMMQFGATAIGIMKGNSMGKRHEIFVDMPDYFTVSMTHAGWVVDERGPREIDKKLQIIAIDTLTGNPVAYEAIEGRVIGLQWHPEIDITNPKTLERLLQELKGYRSFFTTNFRTGPGRVMHNFKQAVPHVKGNSGKAILISALHYLSQDL